MEEKLQKNIVDKPNDGLIELLPINNKLNIENENNNENIYDVYKKEENVDGIIVDGIIEDGIIENVDGIIEDGIIEDGIIEDGIIEDGIIEDGIIEDGIIEDGIIEDGISNNLKNDKNNYTTNYINNILEILHSSPSEIKLPLSNSIEIPNSNVTFTSADLNEIKLFNILNNKNVVDNISSVNSGSESSYTKFANNKVSLEIDNSYKNIRSSKSKSKCKNDENNLDDVDYLYNKLQDYIRYMHIDRKNYILLIIKAMVIIEKYNVDKIDKKSIVIKAYNRIIMIDLNLTDYNQTLFLSSINNIIEIIIICSKLNKNNNYNNNCDDINTTEFMFASSGQVIHSLIDKITTIIIKQKYNANTIAVNICTIVNILIILVNKYTYLTNIEKKTIVEQTFIIFFESKLEHIIELTTEQKQNLILSIDSVPILIDLLISLKNGKYKINRKVINIENKSSIFRKIFFCF